MIGLTFYIEPVAKKRPRFTRKGHTYTAPETAIFERTIGRIACEHTKALAHPVLGGPLIVYTEFFFLRPKTSKNKEMVVKPDLDNLAKSVFDALNGICWKDDAQIVEIHVRKLYSEGQPKIVLRVYEADTPHPHPFLWHTTSRGGHDAVPSA